MMSKELILGFGGLLLLTSAIKGNESQRPYLERPYIYGTLHNGTLKPVSISDTNMTRQGQASNEDPSAVHSALLPSSYDAGAEDFDGTPGDGAFPHIIYDQRQSGKYNVHIVIKDVAIIEMDRNQVEDYMGNDYYYDESDLTVKPLPLHQLTTSSTDLTTAHAATVAMISETNPSTTTQKALVTSSGINAIATSSKVKPTYALYSMENDQNVQNTSSSSKAFKLRVHRPHHRTSSQSSFKRQTESTPFVLKRMLREQQAYHQRRCRSNINCQSLIMRGTARKSPSGEILLNRLLHFLMKLPFLPSEENGHEQME